MDGGGVSDGFDRKLVVGNDCDDNKELQKKGKKRGNDTLETDSENNRSSNRRNTLRRSSKSVPVSIHESKMASTRKIGASYNSQSMRAFMGKQPSRRATAYDIDDDNTAISQRKTKPFGSLTKAKSERLFSQDVERPSRWKNLVQKMEEDGRKYQDERVSKRKELGELPFSKSFRNIMDTSTNSNSNIMTDNSELSMFSKRNEKLQKHTFHTVSSSIDEDLEMIDLENIGKRGESKRFGTNSERATRHKRNSKSNRRIMNKSQSVKSFIVSLADKMERAGRTYEKEYRKGRKKDRILSSGINQATKVPTN